MSTLTWITGEELKRERKRGKKQKRSILLEVKHDNFIAAVRI